MHRGLVLWLVLVLALLLVRPAVSAVYSLGWTPPAVDAGRCWGNLCILRLVNGPIEASYGEYNQPPPVVSGGPPIIP